MHDDSRRKRYFDNTSYSPRRPYFNNAQNPAYPTVVESIRAFRAWELHMISGASWDSVARQLGYSCRQNAHRAAWRFWRRYGVLTGAQRPVGPQGYRSNAPRGLDADPRNIAARTARHLLRIEHAGHDEVVQWPGDLPLPDGWRYPWHVDGPEGARWFDRASDTVPIKRARAEKISDRG